MHPIKRFGIQHQVFFYLKPTQFFMGSFDKGSNSLSRPRIYQHCRLLERTLTQTESRGNNSRKMCMYYMY